MDTTEVTVKEFEGLRSRRKCPYQKNELQRFSEPDQPKVGVNWFAAKAFCEAHSKRLPTEAEFEKAIRGPTANCTPGQRAGYLRKGYL
jgi:formylglycine-generating enzyme required for sulfatase activity